MCLSPPGSLRCGMSCRVWIHFETNWNFVVKFLEEFGESQQFSGASTGCVELCFAWTETDRCLFQTPVEHCHVLYIAMISRNTLACCRIAGTIWVTTTNVFQQTFLNHFARFKTKTNVLRAFEISHQLFHCALALCRGLRTCVESCCMATCMSGLQGAMKRSFPTAVRKLE